MQENLFDKAEEVLVPAWAAIRRGDHRTEAVLQDTGALPPPSQPAMAAEAAGAWAGMGAGAGTEGCALQLPVPSATTVGEAGAEGLPVHPAAAVGEAGTEPSAQPLPLPRPPYLMRFCAAWVYAGMCTVGVSLLEKQKR